MPRQSDIAAAFRESILRSSKGLHFTEVGANAWIARGQSYFVDKTAEHSENRLWMMANMGRVL
ncbi:hypothetical protein [Klebsiella pneumoniae]|uniref:hypothetical protein n=1 Tax=Klebsiella pneumoniae TaxID=573 RepID=UPI000E2BA6FA|nr:hypothetical protein [Klebsiella pneumoniae]SWR16549.1 putative invertase [Klebsiella pneumoniae]SWR17911.1 putative invertase [Klebsiella pneumoniae]